MANFFFIAGEASGDLLGARLIEALGNAHSYNAVAGPRMEATGVKSIFPMSDIALMGFAEILPHIFKLKRRIKETVTAIMQQQPDAVISIDSPGFTFRVAKQLRKQGYEGKLIHYVAPTVWAYKPERAEKTAVLFDALMVILPFEPPYFEKHGLPTEYVGHPIPWEWEHLSEAHPFTKPNDSYLLGMLAGSRMGEIKRHLPIYKETVAKLKESIPNLHVLLPVRPQAEVFVKTHTADWPVPVHIIAGDAQKKSAFSVCDMLLAKSGTVSVECAMTNVPTITTYRANPLSAWLVKRMIIISHVNLINIVAKEAIIPELLQEECNPESLSRAILTLKNDQDAQTKQLNATRGVIQTLRTDGNPAQKAAGFVLSRLSV